VQKLKFDKIKDLKRLDSKFFDDFDRHNILNYYPRPYLERNSFINLNGYFDFLIERDKFKGSILNNEFKIPLEFPSKILVPFAAESFISEYHEEILENDLLWYRKLVQIKEYDTNKRYILNFEKVDQECIIFIDKVKVLEHKGGYLPFSVEISEYLKTSIFELIVLVKDMTDKSNYTIGKQKIERGDIWYTSTSGIYDTVWIEECDKIFVQDLNIATNIHDLTVSFDIISDIILDNYLIEIYDSNDNLITILDSKKYYKFEEVIFWDIDNPYLYKVILKYANDKVISYFSFRKISKVRKNKYLYAAINDKPIIINGLLDQGYYSLSGLTPLTFDEMVFDIMTIKELGFNTIRKHIKIESRRYYYECDRRGIYLIQDFVSLPMVYDTFFLKYFPFFGLNFKDKIIEKKNGVTDLMRKYFKEELEEVVKTLKKHPSIICYTLFNEGWGQFDTYKMFDFLSLLDNSRLIDATSGWFDRKIGDFNSKHRYYLKYRVPKDKSRIISLSEFGGLTFLDKDHTTSNNLAGYTTLNSYQELSKSYQKIYKEQVLKNLKKGLGVSIYTQVSDCEDEVNGILSFDRKVLKIDKNTIIDINKSINSYLK
jgi:beta-galactosidase/beta-glucuronidase